MKLAALLCAMFVLFGGSTPSVEAGEILDRIIAKVNGHAILQSDWEDALGFEAFIDGRQPDQLDSLQRKSALDHLIDQELLREQMHSADFEHASEEEVTARILEIRNQYPDAKSDANWRTLLARYGLTEEDLKSRLTQQLDAMRLIDARLRPAVNVDSKSIESYYNEQLLPQLKQSGEQPVPLADVTPKIKELLTQKKMDQLLVTWLQNLHAGSEIHIEAPTTAPGQAQ
ncbi:MAG: hypothetical protein NVS1B11_23310 [Terriglobales bacterium]